MCELFGISGNSPVGLTLSLRKFARHGNPDRATRDGWGIAYYHDLDVRLIKDTDLDTAFETVLATPARAVLPVTLARQDPFLIELSLEPKVPDMVRDVWLLRHTDMCGTERIDAITTLLLDADLFR